jgi:hypothetical protein
MNDDDEVRIRFTGEALVLTLPALADGLTPRELTIPIDCCGIVCNGWGNPLPHQRGWAKLLEILAERKRLADLGIHRPVLGGKGEPLTWELAKALRSGAKPKPSPEGVAEAKLALAALGLRKGGRDD